MSPGTKKDNNPDDLQLALEIVRSQNNGQMSQYQKDLLKWAKNVDKRYAWVVLAALWLMMAATLGPYRVYGLIYAKTTTTGVYTREEASWPVAAIFTVENLVGPFVSIIAYYTSYRQSMFIGSLLLVLGNGFTGLSRSLVVDVLLIGLVQGVGYAFIFMPFMEIINSYFLRYRNIALGLALSGGTMSVFVWSPIFQYLLENYPWRYSYYGLGAVCAIGLFMVPFLKPNPKPERQGKPPAHGTNGDDSTLQRSLMSRNTVRMLTYQNSIRRQSTILISRRLERKASVISVNPFASTAGIERKISRAIAASNNEIQREISLQHATQNDNNTTKDSRLATWSVGAAVVAKKAIDKSNCHEETISLSEVVANTENFELSIIWDVLKNPAFHMIWYNELIYFWVFSIYCLVIVDYGEDRGCTKEEAETLLGYQSVGELIGRLILTILVDLRFISNKNTVVLVLFIIATLLTAVTQVAGYTWLLAITISLSAFCSLLYILLNGLLVDYLGEKQVTIGYGMASCIGGVLMSFRPQAVGYFRDEMGSYDPLMLCLAASCAIGGVLWIVEPLLSRLMRTKHPEDSTNDTMPA